MEKEHSILAGRCNNVIVLKVYGKGTFVNSQYMKEYTYNIIKGENPEIVIDLSQCTTMDSTFMGTLAGISSKLLQKGLHKLILLNMNEHIKNLLQNLGLLFILNTRNKVETIDTEECSKLEPIDKTDFSKLDSIIHMIEAHQTLIEFDSKNEVKFESVLNLLNKKLKKIPSE